jgi:hypothetical protein
MQLSPPGRGTRLFVNLPTGTALTAHRAAVAGRKNKDLPDDPAILDPAAAGSLASPSDQQIHCCRDHSRYRRSVLAPRAGGL